MGLWIAPARLVLASRSESRHAILQAAGIPHEVAPADIDERLIERRAGTCDGALAAELLAREKALAVSARRPGALVLGADQTLAGVYRRRQVVRGVQAQGARRLSPGESSAAQARAEWQFF